MRKKVTTHEDHKVFLACKFAFLGLLKVANFLGELEQMILRTYLNSRREIFDISQLCEEFGDLKTLSSFFARCSLRQFMYLCWSFMSTLGFIEKIISLFPSCCVSCFLAKRNDLVSEQFYWLTHRHHVSKLILFLFDIKLYKGVGIIFYVQTPTPHKYALSQFIKVMDQVAAKTYLGIAIQEVVKQLGLQKRAKKIYETFFQAFKSNYQAFKNTYHEPSKIDGVLCEHFQYPIGDKETLQYYLAYGEMTFSMASLRGITYLKNSNQAMLQGFSTNEGAKVKNNKRLRKNKNDGDSAYGRKRRNA